MSDINGLHVVYSQILGLSDRPFSIIAELRPVWQRIFQNKCCFAAMNERIGRRYQSEKSIAPTIPGLGSIWLDPSAALLRDKYNSDQLVDSLCHCSPHSDRFSSHPIFGYNPEITDQRMNFLFFQTTKPLQLRGYRNQFPSPAKGKVYAHIYPNGYIILFVSISYSAGISLTRAVEILAEFDPISDRPDVWTWTSKFGEGSLASIVQRVKSDLQHSLFTDQSRMLREGRWYSAIRLATTTPRTDIISAFIPKHRQDRITVLHYFHKDNEHCKHLIIDRSSFILAISNEPSGSHFYESRSRRLFWKMLLLSSNVRISKSVYEDYLKVLHFDILALRAERFSLMRKLLRPRSLRISMHDYVLPLYVSVIDTHIRNAAPFHRWLYSSLSRSHGTEQRRTELLSKIQEWETELMEWETWYSTIARQIFSPVKYLLGSK